MSMKCHLSYVRETQRKVQEIVPYAVSENVKEMLKFPAVGNVHEM